MKVVDLDIPKTAAERIARDNDSQLFTAAARIAAIAEPDDPHAQTELMQAIVDLAKSRIGNPAAMVERLIQAAVDYESAQGIYVASARRELSEARAAVEAVLTPQPSASAKDVRERTIEECAQICDRLQQHDPRAEKAYGKATRALSASDTERMLGGGK